MKKSKVFMAVGSLALVITAIFATKANKKFSGPATVNFSGATYYMKLAAGISFLTTNNSTNTLHTAYGFIYTSSGHKIGGLLTTATHHNKLYYN